MAGQLNVLIVSAECAPFAKTGGLGDVTGSLPQFLKKAGNSVVVVMPLYSSIDRKLHKVTKTIDNLEVWLGDELIQCSVHTTYLPEKVPVYFIEYEPFYNRNGLYHDPAYNDYTDNPRRFAFLSKAALQLCHNLNFSPDIVHANDWHTAVLPAFLKRYFNNDPLFKRAASVLTIHNIAYQGRYNRWYYFNTGLGWEDFTHEKFEHYGDVNFLKGGIYFADQVNTVSEGYALETKTPPLGFGLESTLAAKDGDYTGILNGADYSHWNPETDNLIPASYSKNDLSGKSVCKELLQKQLGLKIDPDIPLIGIVSRFVEQKGFHIITECIEDLINTAEVQFAILGSGENDLEKFFGGLPQRFPGKAGAYIAYDNELAHLIEAGADFFLMPSIYEPCGLNQMYSLKYGTLPIVRATGGLNDTIENYDPVRGAGTGFKFMQPTCTAAYNTIKWALNTYHTRKEHMRMLILNAMSQNFSWDDSTQHYLRMYNKAVNKIR